MTVLHSIRLRFVSGGERLLHNAVERVSKMLGHDRAHAQPAGDVDFGRVGAIQDEVGKCDINHTTNMTVLGDHVDKLNRQAFAPNTCLDTAYLERLAASNNDLINHQNASFGKNHLPSLNPTKAGVEP